MLRAVIPLPGVGEGLANQLGSYRGLAFLQCDGMRQPEEGGGADSSERLVLWTGKP